MQSRGYFAKAYPSLVQTMSKSKQQTILGMGEISPLESCPTLPWSPARSEILIQLPVPLYHPTPLSPNITTKSMPVDF